MIVSSIPQWWRDKFRRVNLPEEVNPTVVVNAFADLHDSEKPGASAARLLSSYLPQGSKVRLVIRSYRSSAIRYAFKLFTTTGEYMTIQGEVPASVVSGMGADLGSSSVSTDIPLPEGWLVSAYAVAGSGAPAWGAVRVGLRLIDSNADADNATRLLAEGFVTNLHAVQWPIAESGARPIGGFVNQYDVANPAAGADWSQTVGTNGRYIIRSVSARFVAGAAVANRQPTIQILDAAGGVVWAEDFSSAAITAGLTTDMQATRGVPARRTQMTFQVGGVTRIVGYLPDLLLMEGWSVRVVTTGIQAADQWSQIRVHYEAHLDVHAYP